MKALLPLFLLIAVSAAEELTIQELKAGLVEGVEAFDTVKLTADGKPVSFDLKLGESPVKIGKDVFDGFRFRCPELPEGTHFVWYFNAPKDWGNWYIVPVEGEPGQAFKGWLEGDKYYETFDKVAEKDRLRILQTLAGSYFTAGKDYLMWFRKTGESPDAALRGTATFAKGDNDWDHEAVEKALGLKEASPEVQIAATGWRGGKILLDREFFAPADAASQIDSAFFSIRSTRRMRGGFFITTQIAVPPCKTSPALAAIRERYGAPDFVRSGEELEKVRKHGDGDGIDKEDRQRTWHYYDHFAFEVDSKAADPKVLRVVTQGSDFSLVGPPAQGSSFATIDIENLTVFHRDGKEVGRAYYFREGDKEPLFITEPPPGVYVADDERLTASKDGEWLWESLHPGGKVARKLPMKHHRLNGKAEGFNPEGGLTFTAEYRNGVLNGEVVRLDGKGKEISRQKFKDGEKVDKK
ncbi:toxin-antitoxin system YwqK family antitoxin [Luteolibacter soli]|uniref:MORN repeat variant n=1 Tax=Luteolibacter soli TaxID=3135280 RepID=A0ABU9B1X1_9BACT